MLIPSGILLLCFAGIVFGNTDILNLAATDSGLVNLAFTEEWPVLSPDAHDIQVNGSSAPLGFVHSEGICRDLPRWNLANGQVCPHEKWLVLDLDAKAWRGFYKFTLRLSWPAFYPTDIKMTVFDPSHLSPFSKISLTSRKTRRKYARIRFTHSGVLTPSFRTVDEDPRYRVPVIVTLEPLHLGILPASVIPVALSIILATFCGFTLAPRLNSYLQTIAQLAREEMNHKPVWNPATQKRPS